MAFPWYIPSCTSVHGQSEWFKRRTPELERKAFTCPLFSSQSVVVSFAEFLVRLGLHTVSSTLNEQSLNLFCQVPCVRSALWEAGGSWRSWFRVFILDVYALYGHQMAEILYLSILEFGNYDEEGIVFRCLVIFQWACTR